MYYKENGLNELYNCVNVLSERERMKKGVRHFFDGMCSRSLRNDFDSKN